MKQKIRFIKLFIVFFEKLFDFRYISAQSLDFKGFFLSHGYFPMFLFTNTKPKENFL